jgi:hypothetical protein
MVSAAKRLSIIFCMALAAAFCGGLPLVAQDATPDAVLTDEQAEEVVQDKLNGRVNYPWYDRAKDDVRQIHVAPSEPPDSPNRDSNWKSKASSRTPSGSRWGSVLGPLLQGLGIALLVALLLTLAYFIAQALLKAEVSETASSKVVETSRDVDRVQALPFQVRKPTGDFLAEARRLYEAGNYSEAIIYLYSYQLVELDRHHVIRLAKGKTNRQYLRETRRQGVLYGILHGTMIAFEDVFFGHHELDRETFELSWRRLDDFHGELARIERAAA